MVRIPIALLVSASMVLAALGMLAYDRAWKDGWSAGKAAAMLRPGYDRDTVGRIIESTP